MAAVRCGGVVRLTVAGTESEQQHGGRIYQEDGIASDLDSEVAAAAFREWTNFYIHYEFPLSYDFVNRFRLGETPIGIADLGTYNNLMVSAPDFRTIHGLPGAFCILRAACLPDWKRYGKM